MGLEEFTALTGYKHKSTVTLSCNPMELCDDPASFYPRLDVNVPHESIEHLRRTLPRDESLSIAISHVEQLFPALNARKS